MIKLISVVGTLLMFFFYTKTDIDLKNGKSIFKYGKNIQGEYLQDLNNSEMSGMYHSCTQCHGDDGSGKPWRKRGPTGSIKFKDLSDVNLHAVPYTSELLVRFIDKELKSDGSKAHTGVAWKMSEKDKTDLIEYLKTLN
jgi:mono/diheme cytochrome c family protein